MIDIYLQDVKESGIDTLILGCTHYPLLRDSIAEYMGEDIHIVNPAYETAIDLQRILQSNALDNRGDGDVHYEFYSSDAPVKFKNFANAILPCNINWIEHINIEEY